MKKNIKKGLGKVEPTTLLGFMELLPDKQMLFNQMLDTIRESYELFGFIPLDTPVIERSNVLLAKGGGDTDKQIYRLKKGDNDLALRFDLTVPLAKYVAKNYLKLQFPFRRYQIGKVYRGERSQRGRYREFYQCDIDIIGNDKLSMVNDAEIPSIIYATFRKLGFGSFTIKINNRKILNGFFSSQGITGQSTEILRIIDKLEKIGSEGVMIELSALGLTTETIEKIFGFIGISGSNDEIFKQLRCLNISDKLFVDGVNELDTLVKMIDRFGVPETNYAIDLTIARGLDYYTGTVYETVLDDYPKIGSICSGGRFDNLAECYTDKKLPGVGISIGLTRLFSQLLDAEIIRPSNSTPTRVLVVSLGDWMNKAIEVSAKLRQEMVSTIVYFEQAKSAKMFKYADRLGIPFVVIIGDTEVAENIVSLKNMETKEQQKLTVEEVIRIVRN